MSPANRTGPAPDSHPRARSPPRTRTARAHPTDTAPPQRLVRPSWALGEIARTFTDVSRPRTVVAVHPEGTLTGHDCGDVANVPGGEHTWVDRGALFEVLARQLDDSASPPRPS